MPISDSIISSVANLGQTNRPVKKFNSALMVDPAYEIELKVHNPDGLWASKIRGKASKPWTISTFLPESFGLQFGSSWDTPYDKSIGEQLAAAGATKAAAAVNIAGDIAGFPNRSKWMSAHVWKNGQPLHFSFPFVFAATNNTKEDVMDKFRFISQLVTPGETVGGFLMSPGPTIVGISANMLKELKSDPVNEKAFKISLRIGNFLYLDNVIVESADSNIDFILDKDGKPMYMTFNVSVKTFYTVTKEDIDKMMDSPELLGNGARSVAALPSSPTLVDKDKVAVVNSPSYKA